MAIQPDSIAIPRYYDVNPTEEDLMGSSYPQFSLNRYLVDVLDWHYRDVGWFVVAELNIYVTSLFREYPLTPDVSAFIGLTVPPSVRRRMRSWTIRPPAHPAPTVVFEVASEETWKKDLTEKPQKYADMGVQEYYAYDPNDPPVWIGLRSRLRGWRFVEGRVIDVIPDGRGWLWSPALDSWLGPDEEYLRLYTPDGRQRLTGEEAENQARQVAESRARTEAEARRTADRRTRAADSRARAEAEARHAAEVRATDADNRARAEAEARRTAETRATDAEAQAAALRAKLREIGIDPDNLT